MNVTIKKWGNSQGIILPKMVLSSLGIEVDDEIYLEVNDGKIILSKPKKIDDYSDLILEDLIKNGYEGKELLSEFRRVKENMPKAAGKLKENLIDEYKNGEMIDYEELFDD